LEDLIMASAGGGSTSGRIDFPDHMKTIHQDWLNQTGSDTIEASMVDKMNAALGGSPFTTMTQYDPATPLTAMDTAVGAFNTRVDALDPDGDWEVAVDAVKAKADAAVFDDAFVVADIAAFRATLETQLINTVLPRFQAGLRDVNAVMSSAFVIGEGIIEGMLTTDVAKYGTDLRLKLNLQRNDFIVKGVESILRNLYAITELEKNVAHYTIEAQRMRIAALKDKKDGENTALAKDGRWDLETFQYGANLLASIGGGTVVPQAPNGPSTGQSIIGGALSGAAVGANVGGGNGWITGGGALIGGLLGGLS
jgi:hypothetical protein